MLRNRIDPIILVGIPLLLIGIFLMFIALQFFQELRAYSSGGDRLAMALFFASGLISCILSIGFMLKQNWARIALMVLVVGGAVAWTLTVYVALADNGSSDFPPVIIGLSILLYGIVLVYFLLLQNDFVLQHFRGEEHAPGAEWTDILDQ